MVGGETSQITLTMRESFHIHIRFVQLKAPSGEIQTQFSDKFCISPDDALIVQKIYIEILSASAITKIYFFCRINVYVAKTLRPSLSKVLSLSPIIDKKGNSAFDTSGQNTHIKPLHSFVRINLISRNHRALF